MKKTVFTLLIFMVCTIQAMAYEYFTIYFNDGTKSEAFYATDVDSICYSKLSLDGIAYDDWQVQEIYTCDSVYRYPLAQIDSLSFKDVDVNKVAEDIAHVIEQSDLLLFGINNPELTEVLIPQLSNINGIEDIQLDNHQLTLKICDWGNVKYYYPPKESSKKDISGFESVLKRISSNRQITQSQQSTLKACIANQQAKDQSRAFFFDIASNMGNAFSAIGIQTTPISMPEPNFFSNDILDYDIAFIKTHGFYDKKDGLHWLVTGQEFLVRNKNGADYNSEKLKQIIQMETFSPRKVCLVGLDEIRNGDTVKVFYIAVSQEFIKIGSKKGERNTIIFNTACQSVMGPSWVSEVENFPDYSLAKCYVDRGASCYLGYDDSNSVGADAGELFLFGMMNGMLAKNSYGEVKIISPDLFHSDDYDFYDEDGNLNVDHEKNGGILYVSEEHPTLRCYPSNSECSIIHPQTLEAEEISNGDLYQFKLHGSMKYIKAWDSKDFSYIRDSHIFGFYVADNPEMDNFQLCLGENEGKGLYDEMSFTCSFDAIFNGIGNKTYYYCAVMNDGYSDCYGEIKEFNTSRSEAYYIVYDDTIKYYYDEMYEQRHGSKGKIEKDYVLSNTLIKKVIFDSSFSNYYPTKFSFNGCGELNEVENLNYLKTDSICDMASMFEGCSSLTSLDLSSFDTSNVTDMNRMFEGCSSLTSLDLSSFDTGKVWNFECMFLNCSSLTELDFRNLNNTSNYRENNMYYTNTMFTNCNSLKFLDVRNLVLGSKGETFFWGLKELTYINLSNADTSNVISMSYMFSGCNSLTSLDLSSFNTSNVTSMVNMFEGCSSLINLDLSSFDTSNVNYMSSMFESCSSLIGLNLNHFNTSNVKSMHSMFSYCYSLQWLDLSNFSVPENTDLSYMFCDCSSLKTLDISHIGDTKITVSEMFRSCNSLETIYSMDWTDVRDGIFLFSYCKNLTGGKGTKIGQNFYGYDEDGKPLSYYCSSNGGAARIDGGKDRPGLFTAK